MKTLLDSGHGIETPCKLSPDGRILQHGRIMHQQYSRICIAVDMDRPVLGLALSHRLNVIASDPHFLQPGIQFILERGDDIGPGLPTKVVPLLLIGTVYSEEGMVQRQVNILTQSLNNAPAFGKAGTALLCAVKDYV